MGNGKEEGESGRNFFEFYFEDGYVIFDTKKVAPKAAGRCE